MSVSPVTTSTVSNTETRVPITPPPVSSQNGVSSTSNSISSAVSQPSAVSQGFNTDWFVGIINTVCDFFAQFPFISHFFAIERSVVTEPETTEPETTEPGRTEPVRTPDEVRLNAIKNKFIDTKHMINIPALAPEDVAETLNLFKQMQSLWHKAAAFEHVLIAANSTDDIVRKFYGELPDPIQTSFRKAIWLKNNKNDRGYGLGFGEHIIATNIRGDLAQRAAEELVKSYVNWQHTYQGETRGR
jgi:hypothetical protein